MTNKWLDNGTVVTLGALGVLAVCGAMQKRRGSGAIDLDAIMGRVLGQPAPQKPKKSKKKKKPTAAQIALAEAALERLASAVSAEYTLDQTPDPMRGSGGGLRLEYTQGTSNKFWEASVEPHFLGGGADLIAWWGRIGTGGQKKQWTYPSTDAALGALDKKVKSKLKKGYVQVD